jgi:predicted PurR-regulated permease PerM
MDTDRRPSSYNFAVVLVVITGVALASWYFSYVLLLAFAALIVAAILHGTNSTIARFTPLRGRWAMLATITLLSLGVAGFLFLLGRQIYEQLGDLVSAMPGHIDRALDAVGMHDMSGAMETLGEFVDPGAFAGGVGAGIVGILSTIGAIVVVIVGGIYLALEPRLYRRGLIALFPLDHQNGIGEAIDASANALKRWLAGQLIAMIAIGTATTLAMHALGLPSALAIGFIAGVLEFVPFVGPILAAIPALLVALAEGEEMVLWVALVYVLIQQIEGNILVPLIQKRTVRLPPALGLLSILAFGFAFGVWGFILATPLAVVLMVLVKKLYIEKSASHLDR